MKVVQSSYQRAGPAGPARFIGALGNKTERLQLDGVGQVAQAMSRVFKLGSEIAIDYTDDLIAFRNVDAVPSIDFVETDEPCAYVSEGDAVLDDLAGKPSNIRSKLRKA